METGAALLILMVNDLGTIFKRLVLIRLTRSLTHPQHLHNKAGHSSDSSKKRFAAIKMIQW